VPTSTDAQIDEITEAIRKLCRGPLTPEAEVDLRRLARELRIVIRRHVGIARYSLEAKKAAIIERDPDLRPNSPQG
jgi:hypothetical protein